jgi:hypothetical protein
MPVENDFIAFISFRKSLSFLFTVWAKRKMNKPIEKGKLDFFSAGHVLHSQLLTTTFLQKESNSMEQNDFISLCQTE